MPAASPLEEMGVGPANAAHRQFLAAGSDQQLQEVDACVRRPAHCVRVQERSDLRPGAGLEWAKHPELALARCATTGK